MGREGVETMVQNVVATLENVNKHPNESEIENKSEASIPAVPDLGCVLLYSCS